MKQRPQYLLEAFAAAGHEVWFVDPRLREERVLNSGVRLVSSLRPVPKSGVILYTHFAPTGTLIDRFEDTIVVYDILDDLSIFDADESGLPDHKRARHYHRELIEDADVVLVSNPVLFDRHALERQDLILIENGVDVEAFCPDGPTASLGESPVVGYHGAISAWFDFPLLESLASERPDFSFHLVGPIDDRVHDQAAVLSTHQNVTFHPPQSAEGVAGYVRSFDVGLVPFVLDEMTQGVTPLKMYEYLASGVPVVASPLPACVAHEQVVTASTAEKFEEAIDLALDSNDDDRSDLRSGAEEASWDRRLAPLLLRLDSQGGRRLAGDG